MKTTRGIPGGRHAHCCLGLVCVDRRSRLIPCKRLGGRQRAEFRYCLAWRSPGQALILRNNVTDRTDRKGEGRRGFVGCSLSGRNERSCVKAITQSWLANGRPGCSTPSQLTKFMKTIEKPTSATYLFTSSFSLPSLMRPSASEMAFSLCTSFCRSACVQRQESKR